MCATVKYSLKCQLLGGAITNSWERLSLYESRDLLSRFYQKRHGRELSAEKAYEIIAHLAQGRGFFTSAGQSSELVRPLLLYYGVYALSRGLCCRTIT